MDSVDDIHDFPELDDLPTVDDNTEEKFNMGAHAIAEVSLPRLNIAVYSLGDHLQDVASQLMVDRRLVNSKVSSFNGGIQAAIEYHKTNITPNILIIEVENDLSRLMNDLFELSEVCDAQTHVILAGKTNDIELYRELIRHGISEYIVLPSTPTVLISAISNLFQGQDTSMPYAPSIAFIGALGGVGTSIIAQSVALNIVEEYKTETVFIDLDRFYPLSLLSWPVVANKGLNTLLHTAQEDIDDALVKSCLSRVRNNLNLLLANSDDVLAEWDGSHLEVLIEALKYARLLSDYNIIDIPSGAITVEKYAALINASKVFIVTDASVKGVRNLGTLYENIVKIRPNDPPPQVIINKVGAPDSVYLEEKDIKENIGITPDLSMQYVPEVIDLAIARGVDITSLSGSEQFARDIKICTDLILGKSTFHHQDVSFLGKIIRDAQKVIGL